MLPAQAVDQFFGGTMNCTKRFCILLVCALAPFSSAALAQDDIAALRQEFAQMKVNYEARISELERRLETADGSAPAASPPAEQPPRAGDSGGCSNAVNPALCVIVEGGAGSR